MRTNYSEINILIARWRGSRGIMEVLNYYCVPRENQKILSRSVLFVTTFFFVFVVILVFQFPVKYHYNH